MIMFMFTSMAMAEVPFNIEAFQKAQKNNEKILLHFHADWCPTCRVQKKVLAKLEAEGILKEITVYSVDFDNESTLKKDLKVNQQSTFIAYLGGVESGRATGITNEADIKSFVESRLIKITLTEQLQLIKEASASKIPPEKAKIMAEAVDKLRQSHLSEKAFKVGDKMPDFSLPDAHGKIVKLKDLLKNGPAIITFYRGSWCPYCNLQLNSYQQHLAEFRSKGASLIAITPEKPDLTVLTEEKKKLEFSVLTDNSNKYASKLGLVFEVNEELKKLYTQFGIDLEKSQGNAEWKLPIPATYIVSKKGKIIYAFIDVDYTKRADPKDLIQVLSKGN